MNPSMIHAEKIDRVAAAMELSAGLPMPNYAQNFQVTYDQDALIDAMAENLSVAGVAQPREIDDLSRQFAEVGEGLSDRPIVITGSCAEDIDLNQRIESLAVLTMQELAVIDGSALRDAIAIQRTCGQTAKPRSSEMETIDGKEVFSYMGDGINGKDPEDRLPDASRMVSSAIQSKDKQEALKQLRHGTSVHVAHEALNLAYEMPFVRIDPKSEKKYLVSAHLPWGGERTNDLDSPHIALLGEVENSVGVKIGPKSDENHIKGLAEALNPDDLPGKIAFMIRVGSSDKESLPPILQSIKEHAPGSVVLYDIHGATTTREDGKKIRHVETIIRDIESLARACGVIGLRLNGVHLETMTDLNRIECVDSLDQDPEPGNVDPRLNPRQTLQVLNAAAPFINQ